jgi:hypothetical protein
MKKLILALAVFLALPLAAQTSSGTFVATVAGFSELGSGTTACQPGPLPTFPPCALPQPSLGVAYSVTLTTVGPSVSVTCTLLSGTLPSWLTLSAKGTSCQLSGTPNTTGAIGPLTIGFTGS